jgi:hypothetical protein
MSGPVRAVLAVLLATGLLAVGGPAAERAHDAHTTTRLAETAARLDAVAARLADRNDATRDGAAGRTVTLRVPSDATLRIGRDRVRWRVESGPWHARSPTVSLRPAGAPLELGAGRHRVRLVLHLDGTTPTVHATRAPPA